MKFQQCLAFMFVASMLASAQAQEKDIDVRRCFQGEQYRNLLTLFDDWNNKRLHLSKAEFGSEFQEFVRIQGHGHDARWVSSRIAAWERLPADLDAQVPLAPGAQLLLLSLYSENADGFSRELDPRLQVRRLRLTLYFILATAQSAAKDAHSDMIHPSHTFAATAQGWTGLWPFCPRAVK